MDSVTTRRRGTFVITAFATATAFGAFGGSAALAQAKQQAPPKKQPGEEPNTIGTLCEWTYTTTFSLQQKGQPYTTTENVFGDVLATEHLRLWAQACSVGGFALAQDFGTNTSADVSAAVVGDGQVDVWRDEVEGCSSTITVRAHPSFVASVTLHNAPGVAEASALSRVKAVAAGLDVDAKAIGGVRSEDVPAPFAVSFAGITYNGTSSNGTQSIAFSDLDQDSAALDEVTVDFVGHASIKAYADGWLLDVAEGKATLTESMADTKITLQCTCTDEEGSVTETVSLTAT